MENSSTSSANVALKWAAIYTATAIVLTYLWQLLNVDPTTYAKFIGYIPFIAFLLLTQKEFRDQLGGFMSYGQAFVAGLLYAVFGGIMVAIFTYIYYGILSPGAFAHILALQREKMGAQGLTDEQLDKAMGFMNNHGVIITTVSVLFAVPIMGAIISLIGAAILKKEPTLLDIEQRNTPVTGVE